MTIITSTTLYTITLDTFTYQIFSWVSRLAFIPLLVTVKTVCMAIIIVTSITNIVSACRRNSNRNKNNDTDNN